MHPIMRKKLRHFNREEYNCDMCCLKDHECQGDKEYCAVKYDSVEVIRHSKKQPVEQTNDEKDVTKPVEPSSLCGQGRCMECPRTLC